MSDQTRRSFLRTAGTVALGAGVLSATATASHFEAQPEHVTLSFDESTLKTYRPALDIPSQELDKFLGLYGLVATSPEYDTGCCVYWSSWTHQEGWLGNLDSHYGDHEPVYVFFDHDSGEVTKVVASIYHWMAGRSEPPAIPMDETHPRLRVISPWHQYTAADGSGSFYGIEDLTSAFQSWLDNGLEDDLEPGTVVNPWIMEGRGDWWRRGWTGFSLNAVLVSAFRSAGIGEEGSLDG